MTREMDLMPNLTIRKSDQIMMSLVHYFVTKENYAPINVQGVKDEIWLENLNDDDLLFIKQIVLHSGSLKEVANYYGVTYPTLRNKLNYLIQKIEFFEKIKKSELNTHIFVPPHNYLDLKWCHTLKTFGYNIISGTKRQFYNKKKENLPETQKERIKI